MMYSGIFNQMTYLDINKYTDKYNNAQARFVECSVIFSSILIIVVLLTSTNASPSCSFVWRSIGLSTVDLSALQQPFFQSAHLVPMPVWRSIIAFLPIMS